MRLTLTTNEGEVLDTLDVTREEFDNAAANPLVAQHLVQQLQPGSEAT